MSAKVILYEPKLVNVCCVLELICNNATCCLVASQLWHIVWSVAQMMENVSYGILFSDV